MKVSTRVEYGVLALTDIAMNAAEGISVPAPEIAERQEISQKYLEQILTQLKQAGLIRAQKGLRGGYTLARPVESITLADILNALDTGILEETDTAEIGEKRTLRDAVDVCLWKKINRAIIGFAESRTLLDFVQECRDHLNGGWDLYMI